MIKLELSYAELSYIRDLVKEEQTRLWHNKWVPMFRPCSDSRMEYEYEAKILRPEIDPDNQETWAPIDEGWLALISKRIQKIEENIRKELIK